MTVSSKMHKSVMTVFGFAAALVLSFAVMFGAASAASPAEQYITDNVQRGMGILSNGAFSRDQRKTEFQGFLLGLTDINAIGRYTLGQYRRGASPEDVSAFDAAFRDFALSVYQSYFSKYSGQTLQVTGSYAAGDGDTVVKTVTVDPRHPRAKVYEVNFRVQSTNGRMIVVDFSVEGVWIRELERNDFTSYLGSHNGDIKVLIAMLKQKTAQQR
jgi:phospholipid transport system substrate-binding protein